MESAFTSNQKYQECGEPTPLEHRIHEFLVTLPSSDEVEDLASYWMLQIDKLFRQVFRTFVLRKSDIAKVFPGIDDTLVSLQMLLTPHRTHSSTSKC